ncbi:protein asteroid homolog 1-like [Artemia franciscana]|uniref:XPG N-terminal domain-containing protein n=1 Tax=Artemia franciscana TaxID=6661 RepID=A0AA88LCB2_ARTSF|nr:hypothetical protein QYM36_004721 [Artemia franciscana]
MGIRGLFTFVENNQNQFMVDYALHSSTIIVDANNLLHLLYRTCSGLNAAFGGDYDKVYSHFDAFCLLLDTCNIKPIMVFDGGLDVDNRKEKTRKKRIRMRMRAAISCDPYRQGSLEVFPLFGRSIFIDACRKHNFQVVQCDYEADDEIALLSRILNCPVLSGDSDFIIFGIELIPLNSLSFSPSLIKVDGGEKTAISCKMFYVDHFLKKIGSLPRSHLPLVGILLGNDYVDLESFQKLWSGMSISKEKGVTDIHRRLKAVTSWLRGQKIESAIEKILASVPENKKEELQKLIESSLNKDIESPSLVQKILNETEHSTLIYSKNNNPLPQWFSTAYRNHSFPSWILHIPCNHKFLYLPQVEKASRSYSLFSAIDIFRAISAVLLSVDHPDISLLKDDSAKTVGIELGVRVDGKLKHTTISFYNNESERVPHLIEIPKLSSLVRMDFFKKVLKIDEVGISIVDLFPDNLKIFICSIIFWLQVSNPTVQQFQSLILMSLMFDAVPCKIGRVRSVEKTERLRKNLKSESSSDGSICQLWYNLCTKDCLFANEKLLQLYQLDRNLIDSDGYDKDTVHTFAEFQIIFFFAAILNRLLLSPYPECDMMIRYNGLFLYNAVNFTSVRQDWMQVLKNADSVHLLLEKVFDAFSALKINLTNLPKEYKKSRKRKNKITKAIGDDYFSEDDDETNSDEEEVDELTLLGNRFASLLSRQ